MAVSNNVAVAPRQRRQSAVAPRYGLCLTPPSSRPTQATAAARNFKWDHDPPGFVARKFKINMAGGGRSTAKPISPKCTKQDAFRHFEKC